MSSTDQELTPVRGTRLLQRLGPLSISQRLLLYLLVTILIGVLAAITWFLIVDLPVYTVDGDGKAFITGIGLSRVFESDAWFAGIGVVVGVVLGIFAWRSFRSLVWIAPIVSGLGAALAGLIGWKLGSFLGPSSFESRLAAAQVGDVIPIILDVRAPVVLALWVLFAELPILIAAMPSDPEDETADSVEDAASVADKALTEHLFVDFGDEHADDSKPDEGSGVGHS